MSHSLLSELYRLQNIPKYLKRDLRVITRHFKDDCVIKSEQETNITACTLQGAL